MSTKNKQIWDTIWQIVKFILTLGLSHIEKRKTSKTDETKLD